MDWKKKDSNDDLFVYRYNVNNKQLIILPTLFIKIKTTILLNKSTSIIIKMG